jgi:hypothetical protein
MENSDQAAGPLEATRESLRQALEGVSKNIASAQAGLSGLYEEVGDAFLLGGDA